MEAFLLVSSFFNYFHYSNFESVFGLFLLPYSIILRVWYIWFIRFCSYEWNLQETPLWSLLTVLFHANYPRLPKVNSLTIFSTFFNDILTQSQMLNVLFRFLDVWFRFLSNIWIILYYFCIIFLCKWYIFIYKI